MTRSLFLVLLFSLTAIAAACSSDAPAATTTPAVVDSVQSAIVEEDIPVEALPDPLPTPYLFTDEVTIEAAPVTETIYVVQPGDTMATIAEQFCLTIEEIQRLNNIVDINELSVGQELRIPIREGGCGAAAIESATAEEEPDEPARPPGEIYIVEEGDTLAEIAAAFGFTWVDLMNYNDLTESQAANLQIGQALIIPPASEEVEDEEEAEVESSEPPG